MKRLVVVALVPLMLAGCATVRPWERETLSHPAMSEEPHPDAASFGSHLAGARESALDPAASGGGGCGCN